MKTPVENKKKIPLPVIHNEINVPKSNYDFSKSRDIRRTIIQRLWRALVRFLYRNPDMWVDEVDVLTSTLPKGVGCEINNICNANCTFCGYGKGPDGKDADPRDKSSLDLKVFRHTLGLFSQSGGGIFSLTPILGEVSAEKEWLERVREARSYPNIEGVSCFTNAILLHRFGSRAILTSGLTHMHISTCFGSKEQYERLYGVDRYDKVVDNVLDILRCNKEMGYPVDIHLNLRQDKPYEPFFSSDLYSELVDLIDDLEKIVILDDLWDNFRGIINLEGLPKGHQFKKQFEEKPLPCYALYRKVEVLYDGTIQACACRVEPELWVGNILDFDSLEEVWRSPGLEKLREDWFDGKIKNCCQTCSHYVPYTTLVDKGTFRVVGKKVVGKILRVIGVR